MWSTRGARAVLRGQFTHDGNPYATAGYEGLPALASHAELKALLPEETVRLLKVVQVYTTT